MSMPLVTLPNEGLLISCVWTVKEFRHRRWEEVLRRKNLFTSFGLTAFAGAWSPSVQPYLEPQFLAIEGIYGLVANVGGIAQGATSVQLTQRVDILGDTQLVLGVGTANQETVTFSVVSGSTYTISATAHAHAQNDPCVRAVLASDVMATLQQEVQYDSVNTPNQRLQSTGGFSPSSAQWTRQFFLSGSQGLFLLPNVGLVDALTIGQGNLHNHVALGYNHQAGTDVEIDATLTLTGM